MHTTGTPVATASLSHASRPDRFAIAGPTSTSGRCARSISASTALAVASGRGSRRRQGDARAGDGQFLDLRLEDIERQTDVHRARPARARDRERTSHVHRQQRRVSRRPGRLGNRRSEVRLRHLLESAAAQLRKRRVPGEQDERRFTRKRGVERTNGIGVTGTARH